MNTNQPPASLVWLITGSSSGIGLRAANDHVFQNIAWSTSAVLKQTRQRFRAAGLQWVEAEAVEDVDNLASWHRAVAAFPDLESVTPRP